MKTLYIECNMGVAGDMLMSALLQLHPNPDDFILRLNSLNIPKVKIQNQIVNKLGIVGNHINITIDGKEEHEHTYQHSHDVKPTHQHIHQHSHSHHHLSDIKNIISSFNISDKLKHDIYAVYNIIAEAESTVHNQPIDNIHFHEVGSYDAITDVTGVCMLIDELNVDNIISSPINVGSGFVKCAHGILPVPAPATALILNGVPIYSNHIKSELCTPTGAALIKYFSKAFVQMPLLTVEKIGYGFGTKEFDVANCVRVFMGENENQSEEIIELKCNIDDMTGEEVAFATQKIFDAGAVDVFSTPIYMKKNRPALLLTSLCNEQNKQSVLKAIFSYTSTIGVRENKLKRYVLARKEELVSTNYGSVRAKTSTGYGVTKTKLEYDDLEKIATENKIKISDIKKI